MQPRCAGPETIRETVQRLGARFAFANTGIAPVAAEAAAETDKPVHSYLEEWIERGFAGEMEYLKRRDASGRLVRASLAAAAPWARSVIVCAAPYHAQAPLSTDPAPQDTGWIARYAWSGARDADGELRPADYHKVLLARLKQMEQALHRELGESHPELRSEFRSEFRSDFRSWAYVDTGPVIERAWAARAGIGWTGKNTCTIDQRLGSFFFLGVILTSLDLPSEAPGTLSAILAADRCGSCTRCLDACPTQALVGPYQMDASRCIAYLTIEKRGAIAEDLRPAIGRQIFGCDICQDVCPWNRKAPFAADPVMEPRPELLNPSLDWLAQLTEQEFGRLFYGSPVKRARFAGLRRNLAIAMGNSGDAGFRARLTEWASDEDAVLAETAQWALAALGE